MPKPLRLVLSGPGLIGKTHLKLLAASERCELAALVGLMDAPSQDIARHHHVPLFEDIADAIAATDPDGAIIAAPNAAHGPQAKACIAHGLPCLIEKPLAESVGAAREIVTLAQETEAKVLVGHHRTYSPLVTAAQRVLTSPDFGDMVTLQGSALFHKPDHYFVDGPWRTKVGGGPILINLVHDIGLMRTFAGEITLVQALDSHARRGFEVEDSVALTFRFESGALGTFLLSDAAASPRSWEQTSGENPAYPHHPDVSCYHFAGTHGALDFPTMRWHSYRDGPRSWWEEFERGTADFTRADPLARQLEHFLDVIEGRAAPRVSAEDGLRNMLVLDAVTQSIKTRHAVAPKAV